MGDERVEPRIGLTGRGNAATPERIRDLRAQQKEAEKLQRAEPERPFASFLESAPQSETSAKDKKRAALPKQGPRPGLLHPGLRDVFGREEDDKETVVLKG